MNSQVRVTSLILGLALMSAAAQQTGQEAPTQAPSQNTTLRDKAATLKSLQSDNAAIMKKRVAEYDRDPVQWEAVPAKLDIEIATYKRNNFAAASELQMKRIAQSGLGQDDLAHLQAAVDLASRSDDDLDRARASELISRTAKDRNITSHVTFTTKMPGAVVRYQDYGTRISGGPAVTVGGMTSTTATLPIGLYYFWVERSAHPTSDKNRLVVITDSQESVDFDEQTN